MAKTQPPVEMPEPDIVVAVYDAKTGAIRHVHQEVTLAGGAAGDAEQSTQRALAFAREMAEKPAGRLQALPLGTEDRLTLLRSRAPLKVDLKTRKIMPLAQRRMPPSAKRSRK